MLAAGPRCARGGGRYKEGTRKPFLHQRFWERAQEMVTGETALQHVLENAVLDVGALTGGYEYG